MLLVKTFIAPSSIDGIGLFAAEFIAKGSHVWQFTPGFDQVLSAIAVEKLDGQAKQQIIKYAYRDRSSGDYVLCCDDARYFNHSSLPNVLGNDKPPDPAYFDIALRDIQPGEELTCDYRLFEEEPAYRELS